MTIKALAACLVAALIVSACDNDQDAGDANAAAVNPAGRQLFQQRCGACHVATAQENRVGPSLLGLFGRPAGTIADFSYSDAMRGSGIVWTDETLTAYLAAPRDTIPGNRMAFAGLARGADIEAVLDYLRVVTAPQQN